MCALPKRRQSRTRTRLRRSHLALTLARPVACPQCRSPRLPHAACPTCGYYRGREVVKVSDDKDKKKS